MTQKNTKSLTLYDQIDEERGRKVSGVAHITVSEAGTVHVGAYLLFGNVHIHVGASRGYRRRSEQFRPTQLKYRTKTEDRRRGMGAFKILERHREDMDSTDDSLTTEFMMDLIAGFKREETNR